VVELAVVMFIILAFILVLVGGLKAIERDRRPAEEQLKARFARGEISEGEYLRSLAILQHGTDFVLESDRAPAPLPREPGAGDP
jgi:uncharacterized membrane protein